MIREVRKNDLAALKDVIDSSELFPSYLLDDMIHDYLNDQASEDIWLTATNGGIPIGVMYCAPEKLTEGTYNLYAMAIHKDYQGQGIGTEMIKYLENLLRQAGHRLLLVETSSLPVYTLTRRFYRKCTFEEEAVIRDFYREDEHKVIFWKKIR